METSSATSSMISISAAVVCLIIYLKYKAVQYFELLPDSFSVSLFACLEHPVERRLGGSAKLSKAGRRRHFTDCVLARDGAQGRPAKGQRIRRTAQRRSSRKRSTDRIKVFLDRIARHR